MKLLFSKPLSTTDISKRLAIPTRSLRWLPSLPDGGHETEMELWEYDAAAVDGIGKTLYKFTVSIRKTGKYPKPVFSKGWLDFVSAKGPRVGDKVKVYRKKPTARLFGNFLDEFRYYIAVEKGAEASGARFHAAAASGVAAAAA